MGRTQPASDQAESSHSEYAGQLAGGDVAPIEHGVLGVPFPSTYSGSPPRAEHNFFTPPPKTTTGHRIKLSPPARSHQPTPSATINASHFSHRAGFRPVPCLVLGPRCVSLLLALLRAKIETPRPWRTWDHLPLTKVLSPNRHWINCDARRRGQFQLGRHLPGLDQELSLQPRRYHVSQYRPTSTLPSQPPQ